MRQAAHSFITSFGSHSPEALLSDYFTDAPEILEHGPVWATSRLPFLGTPFKGTEACLEYFRLLSATLKMAPGGEDGGASIPSPESFVVDAGADCVVVKLENVVWEAVNTGKRWTESNMHRLTGWKEVQSAAGGGGVEHRFTRWEVFADPLAAWIAVQTD